MITYREITLTLIGANIMEKEEEIMIDVLYHSAKRNGVFLALLEVPTTNLINMKDMIQGILDNREKAKNMRDNF